jgi:hypothetical protein
LPEASAASQPARTGAGRSGATCEDPTTLRPDQRQAESATPPHQPAAPHVHLGAATMAAICGRGSAQQAAARIGSAGWQAGRSLSWSACSGTPRRCRTTTAISYLTSRSTGASAAQTGRTGKSSIGVPERRLCAMCCGRAGPCVTVHDREAARTITHTLARGTVRPIAWGCVRYARPRRTLSHCSEIRRAREPFLASLGGAMRISSSSSAPELRVSRPPRQLDAYPRP